MIRELREEVTGLAFFQIRVATHPGLFGMSRIWDPLSCVPGEPYPGRQLSRISGKTQHTSWICLSDTDTMQELLKEVLYLYHRDKITMLPTHWLSLGQAVERLLQSWPAIVSYFKALGTDCPKSCQMLGAASDGCKREDDGGIQLSITETYPQFSLNLCNMFEKTIAAGKRFCHILRTISHHVTAAR